MALPRPAGSMGVAIGLPRVQPYSHLFNRHKFYKINGKSAWIVIHPQSNPTAVKRYKSRIFRIDVSLEPKMELNTYGDICDHLLEQICQYSPRPTAVLTQMVEHTNSKLAYYAAFVIV